MHPSNQTDRPRIRLPLACREDLLEELAYIAVQREKLAYAEPRSDAHRDKITVLKADLDHWTFCLRAQLEEMEASSCS